MLHAQAAPQDHVRYERLSSRSGIGSGVGNAAGLAARVVAGVGACGVRRGHYSEGYRGKSHGYIHEHNRGTIRGSSSVVPLAAAPVAGTATKKSNNVHPCPKSEKELENNTDRRRYAETEAAAAVDISVRILRTEDRWFGGEISCCLPLTNARIPSLLFTRPSENTEALFTRERSKLPTTKPFFFGVAISWVRPQGLLYPIMRSL